MPFDEARVLLERLDETVADECRLAGAGDAGDGDQLSERDRDVEPPQVVRSSIADREAAGVGAPVALVLLVAGALAEARRAVVHQPPAVLAGARPELDGVVGARDDGR